jgi:hypothetical protein
LGLPLFLLLPFELLSVPWESVWEVSVVVLVFSVVVDAVLAVLALASVFVFFEQPATASAATIMSAKSFACFITDNSP